jgi:hypothetical protein
MVCDKGRQYTPWVLIRFNYTDAGLRPLPANTVFWVSPDIWVESSDPFGQPVAGENNYVHARVFNLGKAPAYPTRVQFYWGDPSLGLDAANMHPIGTEWPYIPAHGSLDVRCSKPWVPRVVNGGHECLIVNSSNPMRDPITNPFQAWLDRHVGQRNVMVLPAPSGQMLMVNFAVNNVLPLMARTQVLARFHHIEMNEKAFHQHDKKQLLNDLANFGQATLNTPKEVLGRYASGTREERLAATVAASLSANRTGASDHMDLYRMLERSEREVKVRATSTEARGEPEAQHKGPNVTGGAFLAAPALLSPAARVVGGGDEFLLQTIALEPNERRTLQIELQVPGNTRRGEFLVMHVVQRVEAVPIGGYTVVVQVT